MAFPKGQPNPNAGRPPGSINGATQKARVAIAAFVDNNAERLNGWLDAIALESPKDAFDCFMKVVDYHIPKIQRMVVAGDPDAPLQSQLTVAHLINVLPDGTKEKLRQALEKEPLLLEQEKTK